MKKVLFPILVLVLALGLTLPMAAPAEAHMEGYPFTVDLLAGQTEDVGGVKVWNDATNLYVQYALDAPWVMSGSHLYVGKSDPSVIGMWSTPGQLPYSPDMEKSPSPNATYNSTTMTYTIPLGEIYAYKFESKGKKGKGKGLATDGDPGVNPCDDIWIAAHADVLKVEQEETAWAEGDQFGTNWAMYFDYHVQFPMELGGTGNYTAEWSTTQYCSPPSSIHLAVGNFTGPSADEARIVITLPAGTTLGDIESISWNVILIAGYIPHVDLVLDIDGDENRDAILVAEGAYQNGDSTTGWATGTCIQTFEGADGTYPLWSGLSGNQTAEEVRSIQDNTAVWLSPAPSPPGPPDQASLAKLSDYKAGLYSVNSTTPVLVLEIEVDNWVAASEAYIDDIEIDLNGP